MLLKKLSTVRVLLCLPATASIIILCSCPLSRRECTSHKSGTIFATTASIAGNRIVGVLTKPDFCDKLWNCNPNPSSYSKHHFSRDSSCTSRKSGTVLAIVASIVGYKFLGVLTKPDFCANSWNSVGKTSFFHI